MYIVHPIKSFEQRAASLLSTHPPTQERIAILRSIGKSASLADYERAWRQFHSGKRLVGSETLKAASEHAPVRAASEKPTTQQTPQERLARAHQALDMMRRLGGFVFLTCACGARLKVPPNFPKSEVRCPRCGTVHKLPAKA